MARVTLDIPRIGDVPRRTLRVAAVQVASDGDVDANVRRASSLVDAAAVDGAELVVLPEKWNGIGGPDDLRRIAEPADGPTITAVRTWATSHGIWILAGSTVERLPTGDLANVSLLVAPTGDVVARYEKVHMFDVEVGGVAYNESDVERPGDHLVVSDGPGVRIGMSICYDLRFPELHRELATAGADIVVVPAAFTLLTGRDHWEILLRARAIENQVFVVGANLVGEHGDGKVSSGRSMIVDPWGVVLAQASDAETVIVADLDLGLQQSVRSRMPVLEQRRPDAYAQVVGGVSS